MPKSTLRVCGSERWPLFLVCTNLVKSSCLGALPLGIRFVHRYSDNEASRMSQLSPMEKVISDPVLSAFELPLRRTFYPYGFPLERETNSADVMAAAADGWGAFEQAFEEPPVRFSLGVLEGGGDALPVE